MKVDKIPYVSLDYRTQRDEYKNWEFSHVYSDDFYLDLGWEVESDASLTSGAWERQIPTVIPLHANVIQTFPIEDIDGDCGNYYVDGVY